MCAKWQWRENIALPLGTHHLSKSAYSNTAKSYVTGAAIVHEAVWKCNTGPIDEKRFPCQDIR